MRIYNNPFLSTRENFSISRRKLVTRSKRLFTTRRRVKTRIMNANKNGIKFIEIVRQRFLVASIGYHLSVSLGYKCIQSKLTVRRPRISYKKETSLKNPLLPSRVQKRWRMLKAPRSLTPARLHNCNAMSGSCFLPSSSSSRKENSAIRLKVEVGETGFGE